VKTKHTKMMNERSDETTVTEQEKDHGGISLFTNVTLRTFTTIKKKVKKRHIIYAKV